MRLNKHIDDVATAQIKEVVKKCSQYFEEVGTIGHLYRGTNTFNPPVEIKTPRENRVPKDTEMFVHHTLDDLMYKKFGWRPRSSGVFATARPDIAWGYGQMTTIFVPTNGYKYLYATLGKYDDMADVFTQQRFQPEYWYNRGPDDMPYREAEKQAYEEIVPAAEIYMSFLSDTQLVRPIKSGQITEIMFKCDRYYLIDRQLGDPLHKAIEEHYGK